MSFTRRRSTMEALKLLFGLFLISFVGAIDSVVELTDSDFSDRIAEHETVLVMFYAPWCGHCKRLKPEYEKAAGSLRDNDPPVVLAKVDCTEGGKESCNKHSVTGYPTLKIFRNGELSQDYNGPREAAGIVKYMQSQVGPSSKELQSVADLDKFLSKDDVSVVGFFEKDSDLKTAFTKLADKLREKIRFAHTSVSDVLQKQGLTDGVVLFRPGHLKNKFEPDSVQFDGAATKEAIDSFITKNYHGLVGHRQRDNVNDFKNPQVIAYYSVDYVKNAKGTNYWRNRLLKVAKDYTDFTFAISSKDDFQHELNEFGLDFVAGDKPVVFARNSKNQKFNMKDEFSVETLDKFVQDVQNDKLEPFLKSEPLPDDNSGPVKIAVAKNFDEIVTNNNQDTLIEFYAPWCGHCKKLAPVYDDLGDKLRDEDVSIVKVDATANDIPPQFEVRGFPTLFWAPRDDKANPVKYEGGRELEDFVKYIAKHSTDGLKGYDRNGKPKKEEL